MKLVNEVHHQQNCDFQSGDCDRSLLSPAFKEVVSKTIELRGLSKAFALAPVKELRFEPYG
jgi:hypothetical protein